MESWIRILFLTGLLVPGSHVLAEEKQAGEGDRTLNQIIQTEPLIQPEITRREIKEAAIDTENFELGAFVGLISIEDFGTNPVVGVRLDYHITEDLFIQGTVGVSEAGSTSADFVFGGPTVLSSDQKDYLYYDIAIGYNLLPGEAFIGRNKAFNTTFYLVAGAGSTDFAGDDRFTLTIGGGYRVTVTDWMTVHLDARDHIFSIDVTGEDKDAHNLELTMGISFFF